MLHTVRILTLALSSIVAFAAGAQAQGLVERPLDALYDRQVIVALDELGTDPVVLTDLETAQACEDDVQCLESVALYGALTKAEMDVAKEAVKNKLDSLSELGEMESLRLQMAMDRMSKLMSTLSNMLKKISDTANSITQNMK